MAVEDRLLRLKELNRRANLGGGETRIRRQHKEGKLLARGRIEILLATGSFVELDRLRTHECNDFDLQDQKIPGDAVVTGSGVLDGRMRHKDWVGNEGVLGPGDVEWMTA